MAKIEALDQNFAAIKAVTHFQYRSVWSFPQIAVEGLHPGTFCRLDPNVLQQMTEGVQELAWLTASGVVRFRTGSSKFGIRMQLRRDDDLSHMPRTGSSGLDIYIGTGENCRFFQSTRPDSGKTEIETECILPPGVQDVTLYLPLYNGLYSLELGFPENQQPSAPTPHNRGHVVFYGSSITQGGCASRTGNSYVNMLGRMLDCSIHNLGFSGGCKAEPEMADYIASLSMDALVLDYDHNAPSAAYLRQTHLPFLKKIIEKHPGLPVAFVTKPDFDADPMAAERRAVIRESYLWAQAQGLPSVFIDGETLFNGPMRDACTVDGCHPNDLGFYRMATVLYPAIDLLLPRQKSEIIHKNESQL